jgi:hypothetical protein
VAGVRGDVFISYHHGAADATYVQDLVAFLTEAGVSVWFDEANFSNDAVGIEGAMHSRLASRRVNLVNHRREFFYVTPHEAKQHLLELAGDLLEYTESPEALEYRQSLTQSELVASATATTPTGQ